MSWYFEWLQLCPFPIVVYSGALPNFPSLFYVIMTFHKPSPHLVSPVNLRRPQLLILPYSSQSPGIAGLPDLPFYYLALPLSTLSLGEVRIYIFCGTSLVIYDALFFFCCASALDLFLPINRGYQTALDIGSPAPNWTEQPNEDWTPAKDDTEAYRSFECIYSLWLETS